MAACLLVFGCGRTPRRGAVWRVLGVSVAFTALAAVGTVVTGGNYMYLRHKPSGGSLLDLFGTWPWYIAGGALVAVALFLILARLANVSGVGPRAR